MSNITALADKLQKNHGLSKSEYYEIIKNQTPDDRKYIAGLARIEREKYYGNAVFVRGLVEITNICKNNCYYCGIRKANKNCERYRLTDDEIFEACDAGHRLGFRTFVLQGGEDMTLTDERLTGLVAQIKHDYPDSAVTLSLGERSLLSYQRLKNAGADRYLLRHETINREHYSLLHPESMSFDDRLQALRNLRDAGFQVGSGFMVGSPYQTKEMLADELCFVEKFKPDMCGIGPFIPHKDTQFRNFSAGSVDMTCLLLSLIRLIHPRVLLPATTALATLSENGREKGLLSGANVVMPNLSPVSVRKKYMLYDNKLFEGDESAEELEALKKNTEKIGYKIVTARGDVIKV